MAGAVGDETASWVMPQPPYGAAPGPLVDDATVLAAFAGGDEGEAGHSRLLHVEGPALMADGDLAAGLRIGPQVVLVRIDLPEDLAGVGSALGGALAAEGLECLDQDSLLAGPVALQVLGLRLSSWDLWGTDLDGAFDALRRGAVGDQELPTW